MQSQHTEMISNLLSERNRFILIGLTGRTGSGCTTAATFLEQSKPNFPKLNEVRVETNEYFKGLDRHRYKNIHRYATKNHNPFFSIKVSDLISAYLLNIHDDQLSEFISECSVGEYSAEIAKIISSKNLVQTKVKSESYKKITKKILEHDCDQKLTENELKNFYLYMSLIRIFTEKFKQQLNDIEEKLYLNVYQAAGNSIRRISKVDANFNGQTFIPSSIYHLPETINKVIKLIRKVQKSKPCYIVIDAIRNPYEAKFFKDRYAAFYLMSINAPNDDRKAYLQRVHKYSVDQFDDLEKKESGNTNITNADFVSQNVQKCIEISDIHIFNPRKEPENHNVLKAQLAWYVTLMQHPGFITPTALERVMQIAYTAKMNSGCISRQVGAVVTDTDYSIKAVGWNDVAKGQVPCNLRSLDGLQSNYDPIIYSNFERQNERFRDKAKIELDKLIPIKESTGRNLAYCFKSLKNGIDGEKNQVHTRSLHAEENAFLQLAKYGGMGIQRGKLFTTASPCELCAKKAYQLGIEEIIYIDPYPGIAMEHILAVVAQT